MNPGIYYNIPFNEYVKIEAMNNTVLKIFSEKTPMHAKYYMDNGREETAALAFGKALHYRLLEPELFASSYVKSPKFDRRTKQGKADAEAFEVANQGKESLVEDEWNEIQTIASQIENNLNSRLIKEGKPEVVIIWKDSETGLLCKARLDYLHLRPLVIVDVKSTQDASPEAFARSILNYGYHQQAAFYADGTQELTGDETPFVFFAIEKTPPYGVAAYEVRPETIAAGRMAYRKALNLYAECLKSGRWEGYPQTVKMIGLPDWYLRKNGINEYELI